MNGGYRCCVDQRATPHVDGRSPAVPGALPWVTGALRLCGPVSACDGGGASVKCDGARKVVRLPRAQRQPSLSPLVVTSLVSLDGAQLPLDI